jgi:hypothetical protein
MLYTKNRKLGIATGKRTAQPGAAAELAFGLVFSLVCSLAVE